MGRGGGPTNGANSFSAQLHSSCALSPAALSFPLIDVCSEKNKHPGVLWLLHEAKINRTPWKKIPLANYMMTEIVNILKKKKKTSRTGIAKRNQ